MPAGPEARDSDAAAPSKMSLRQRVLLRMPRLKSDREKAPIGERLKSAVLKPAPPGEQASSKGPDGKGPQKSRSLEELEEANRYADDKERLLGLIAAPLAAAIGFLVIHYRVVQDPPAHLKSGALDKLHVNPSIYYELFVVLIVLSVLMLVTALLRKRLYLGMVMGLFGLAIFNLHYWGFGVPFIMGAAWLLVRAYRAQRDLKEATGARTSRAAQGSSSTRRESRKPPVPGPPRTSPDRRFMPRTSPSGRAVRSKPAGAK